MSSGSWRFSGRTPTVEAEGGFFKPGRIVVSEDSGWTSGCHGLRFRGCRAVLFGCGCTPTHPFVDPTARCGRRSARGRCSWEQPRGGHGVFSCDRLADTWPSQSAGRPARGRVQVAPQTGLVSRGPLLPEGTRADATVTPPSRSLSFSKALLRAPSAFAVASALTGWRSLPGTRRRRRRMGRTPFGEPERRSSRPTSSVAVCVAGGRRSRTVRGISPSAKRSSPADASPPPALSSIRDAS